MYYLPVYLLIASIITVYLCIRASMHPRVTSKVRFLKVSDGYEDLKTGQLCNMWRDKFGYPFYCSYGSISKYPILSERTYTEKSRWNIAKENGYEYFKSTARPMGDLIRSCCWGSDCTIVRKTDTGQLYLVSKNKPAACQVLFPNRCEISPIEEDGTIGAANCKLYTQFTESKEISMELYKMFMSLPELDTRNDYGNCDISFMQDKTNKRFKNSWLWK